VYRVKTSVLRQSGASAAALASAVERVAETFPADGLWMDAQDRLYLSNINESAVYRLLKNGSLEKVVADSRLQWPDTFTQGPDGSLYVTASHIHDAPQFHHGKSARTEPFSVFKFTA
jgi:sugar lactone lactonase YvrE